MNTVISRLLLLVIIVLLGVLGILRSNEGFNTTSASCPPCPSSTTSSSAPAPAPTPAPPPTAQNAMNAVLSVSNMGITDAQRQRLAMVIGYLKMQGASMTTGGSGGL